MQLWRERAFAHALERVSPADSFTSTRALLFLLAGREARLPSRGLLAWRRSYCLDLLFLGLLGFPVTFLLALGHVDLLWVDDDAAIERQISHCRVAHSTSRRTIDIFGQLDFPDLMQTGITTARGLTFKNIRAAHCCDTADDQSCAFVPQSIIIKGDRKSVV